MSLKSAILSAIIVFSFIAQVASVLAVPGITVCGTIYSCGDDDGVCPLEFGAKCDAPDWCDEDCNYKQSLENSDEECSDNIDNDCDGKKDCDDFYCSGLADCGGEKTEVQEKEIVILAPVDNGGEAPAPQGNPVPTVAIAIAGGAAAIAAGAAYMFFKGKK